MSKVAEQKVNKEIFLPLSFNPNYMVSNRGRVRTKTRYVGAKNGGKRKKRWQFLKKTISGNGYLQVSIKSKMYNVHRLVLETFFPLIDESNPSKLICNHKDGVKTNNSIENLEWVTYKQNNDHAKKIDYTKLPKCKKCKCNTNVWIKGLCRNCYLIQNRKNSNRKGVSVQQWNNSNKFFYYNIFKNPSRTIKLSN